MRMKILHSSYIAQKDRFLATGGDALQEMEELLTAIYSPITDHSKRWLASQTCKQAGLILKQ